MPTREIYFAHELDAAWIIALWKAIHGGDPSPEVVAAQAIAALAQYVNASAQPTFSLVDLKEQFAKLGVQVSVRGQEGERATAKRQLTMSHEDGQREFPIHQYCFKFREEAFCTELPALTHLLTAA